jgi:hypothetical protein
LHSPCFPQYPSIFFVPHFHFCSCFFIFFSLFSFPLILYLFLNLFATLSTPRSHASASSRNRTDNSTQLVAPSAACAAFVQPAQMRFLRYSVARDSPEAKAWVAGCPLSWGCARRWTRRWCGGGLSAVWYGPGARAHTSSCAVGLCSSGCPRGGATVARGTGDDAEHPRPAQQTGRRGVRASSPSMSWRRSRIRGRVRAASSSSGMSSSASSPTAVAFSVVALRHHGATPLSSSPLSGPLLQIRAAARAVRCCSRARDLS